MQDKDAKGRLLGGSASLLHRGLDVLFQLADGVLERRARVVDLVDNEDVFANQVGHLQRGEVQPLCARHFCAWGFDVRVGRVAELLVEGEADGLDGDVGVAGALEERAGGQVLVGGLEGFFFLGTRCRDGNYVVP